MRLERPLFGLMVCDSACLQDVEEWDENVAEVRSEAQRAAHQRAKTVMAAAKINPLGDQVKSRWLLWDHCPDRQLQYLGSQISPLP
jgi:hypothetical protein